MPEPEPGRDQREQNETCDNEIAATFRRANPCPRSATPTVATWLPEKESIFGERAERCVGDASGGAAVAAGPWRSQWELNRGVERFRRKRATRTKRSSELCSVSNFKPTFSYATAIAVARRAKGERCVCVPERFKTDDLQTGRAGIASSKPRDPTPFISNGGIAAVPPR
jgi:hypothetical protein